MRNLPFTLFVFSAIFGLCTKSISEETAPTALDREAKSREAVPAQIDSYRLLIRENIERCREIFSPSVRGRLLEELKRPIALGGKSGHFPPSTLDLSQGWEVFENDSNLKAVVEFTEGEIALGNAIQVVVSIAVSKSAGKSATVKLTMTTLGAPATPQDIEKLKLGDAELKAIGL